MSDRIKGADLSSLLEVEEAGGKFYDQGRELSAPVILKNHGVNLVRLRLWKDPYDANGTPYGAGTNDLPRTMELARRCKALGLPWLLDLHYSDFWADPGKQILPKAWRGLDAEGLERAVYDYTRGVLAALGEADLMPALVAPGNEITNGLLWPLGKTPNFANIARFVSAGIRAVREADPNIRVMVHLDNGGRNDLYRWWFDSYFAQGGADFDLIGLSYYPFWHGKMNGLRENLRDLARRYGKPMLVVETSTAFTLEPYAPPCPGQKGLAANERTAADVDYPMTPEGQAQFLRDLWAVICGVPDGLGRGLCWWEPAWIPVPNSHWATPEALAYTGETGAGGNEWANQCLFDYQGRALPALSALEAL